MIGLGFTKDLVGTVFYIIDRIGNVAALDPVRDHQIDIPVYSKVAALIKCIGIIVPSAFAHSGDIISVGLGGRLIQAVKVAAGPGIICFNFLDDRICTSIDRTLIAGENANSIFIRLIFRRGIRRKCRKRKRCNHADRNQHSTDPHKEIFAFLSVHPAHALPPLCLRLSRRL